MDEPGRRSAGGNGRSENSGKSNGGGFEAGTVARRGNCGDAKGEADNSLLPGIEGFFSFGRVFPSLPFAATISGSDGNMPTEIVGTR